MKRFCLFVLLPLTLSACSGTTDDGHGSVPADSIDASPVVEPAPVPEVPAAETPVPELPVPEVPADDGAESPAMPPTPTVSFLTVSPALGESDNAAAELTRTTCFADYERIGARLGTASAVEVFHRPGGPVVDVEWIEPGSPPALVDGPVARRQGAGATFVARVDELGIPVCDIVTYDSFGFVPGEAAPPATAFRIDDAAIACLPDSARGDVAVATLPRFVIEANGVVHSYGTAGRTYTLVRGGEAPLVTTSGVGAERVTLADGEVLYRPTCSVPGPFANGESALLAPPVPVGDGPLYLGRPWQISARLAQDALDATSSAGVVTTVRRQVDAAAATLGLDAADAVETLCPAGGLARATTSIGTGSEERRREFIGCDLGDGRTLDGVHESLRRTNDSEYSVHRTLDERFVIATTAPGSRLAIEGTLSDALTGTWPDACDLVRRESVLRLDIPRARIDTLAVRQLAVEDITNLRIAPPSDNDGCGTQETEYAFSDSARLVEASGTPAERLIAVNRTGSVLRGADGRDRPSGGEVSIRIYSPAVDDSLDLGPRFGVEDGATIVVDEHPGRVEVDGFWRFVAR